MVKLIHLPKGQRVDVAPAKVDYYTSKGWGPAEEQETEPEGLVIPDPEKANHEAIDSFAAEQEISFDGIDAKDADKPTKAEKVAHITKAIAERDAAQGD